MSTTSDDASNAHGSNMPETQSHVHNESFPDLHNVPSTVEGPSETKLAEKYAESQHSSQSNHSSFVDDDDDEDYRENRWQGPDSTWRYYTRDERSLVASLGQQQADDLSIHLFNAHALKRRLYDPSLKLSSAGSPGTKAWSSKQKWMRRNSDGLVPWHPSREWASWPLKPDEVPRSNEAFGKQGENFRDDQEVWKKSERWYPSMHLEEELMALMLKRAKEQFMTRKWEVPLTTKERRSQSRSSSAPSPNRERFESDLRLGSRINGKEQSPEVGSEVDDDEDQSYSIPSFLTDDDQARLILIRPVRHIISKLDDLLVGLHKSRVGQAATKRHTKRSRSLSRKAKLSLSRNVSKHDQSSANEEADDDDDDDDSSSSSPVPESPRKRQRLEEPKALSLGIRDWSEVLGIASLVGWDQDIIDRTAKRCSALFGEDMSFRVLPETTHELYGSKVVQYIPSQLPDIPSDFENYSNDEEMSQSRAATASVTNPRPIGLYCPNAVCPRHNEPFAQPFRLREHLKRVHNYNSEMVSSFESELMPGYASSSRPSSMQPSSPGNEDQAPPDPLICPIGGCSKPEKVYTATRRLAEHLRRAHGINPKIDGWPRSAHVVREDVISGSEEHDFESDSGTVGAVHNDGFLEPITLRMPNKKRKPSEGKSTSSRKGKAKAKRRESEDLSQSSGFDIEDVSD